MNKFKYNAPCLVKELLFSVKDDIIESLQVIISKVQKNVLKELRQRDNILCSKKCADTNLVHNFTSVVLPPKICHFLEMGLNSVPHLVLPENELFSELVQEAKMACKNLFQSFNKTYPRVNKNSSFGATVLEIISQCQANTELVSRLIHFRDQFVENIPFFLSFIPQDGKIKIKEIIDLI